MAGGIFDQMVQLDLQKTTIVFIVSLCCLICLEKILSYLEHVAEHSGFGELVAKLLREMTIMGLLTFATFLVSEGVDLSSDWYYAFHFCHIFLLFCAINHVIQTVALIHLMNRQNRLLLQFAVHSAWDLVDEFWVMARKSDWNAWWFEKGPTCFPFTLRSAIESKICEGYFIHVHKLPNEFNFANYMCRSCIRYVLKLVEVAPINWIFVIGFALLNILRVMVIDSAVNQGADDECEIVEDVSAVDHRMLRYLVGDDHDDMPTKRVCFGYLVKSYLILGCMLMCFNITLLYISDCLYHRLMWRIYVHLDETCRLVAGVDIRKHTAHIEVHPKDESARGDIEDGNTSPSTRFNSVASMHIAGEECFEIGEDEDAEGEDHLRTLRTEHIPEKASDSEGASVGSRILSKIGSLKEGSRAVEAGFFSMDSMAQERGSGLNGKDSVDMDIEFQLFKGRAFYEYCLVLIAEESERAQAEAIESALKRGYTPRPGSRRGSMEDEILSFRSMELGSNDVDRNFPLAPVHHKVKRGSYASTSGSLTPVGRASRAHTMGSMSPLGRKGAFARMSAPNHNLDIYPRSKSAKARAPSYHQGRQPHQSLLEAYASFGENVMRRRSSIEREDVRMGDMVELHHQTSIMERFGSAMHHFKEFMMGEDDIAATPRPVEHKATSWQGGHSAWLRGDGSTQGNDAPTPLASFRHTPTSRGQDMLRFFSAGPEGRGRASTRSSGKRSGEYSAHFLKNSSRQHTTSLGVDRDDRRDQYIDWNLRVIFAPGWSTWFYRAVSVMCLLQSVYTALWVTDFTSLAARMEHSVLWQFLLILPVIINFLVMHHTIFLSGIIRAMTHRNVEILDDIVEEAREQKHVARDLRKAIVEHLIFCQIPEIEWRNHVLEKFQAADEDGSEEINSEEFLGFFRELDVHFSRKTTIRIFRALDRDKSGTISWREIQAIIFPEFQFDDRDIKSPKEGEGEGEEEEEEEEEEEGGGGGGEGEEEENKKNKKGGDEAALPGAGDHRAPKRSSYVHARDQSHHKSFGYGAEAYGRTGLSTDGLALPSRERSQAPGRRHSLQRIPSVEGMLPVSSTVSN